MKVAFACLAIGSVGSICSDVAAHPPRYAATVLEFPAEYSTQNLSLNNNGELSIGFYIDEGERSAVYNLNTGSLSLIPLATGSDLGELNHINHAGECVGWSRFGGEYRAVVYRNGVILPIEASAASQAAASNNNGLVAGWIENRPTIWDLNTGQRRMLSTAYPGGAAYDINDSGVAVGYSQTSNPELVPVVWEGSTRTHLPNLGSNWGMAKRVNNAGQVMCISRNAAGELRTYRWTSGVIEEFAQGVPGRVTGIDMNEAGVCVGSMTGWGGFVFIDGATFNLDECVAEPVDPPLNILRAECINDLGQIIAVAAVATSVRVVLLDPLRCGPADFDQDGEAGTSADIQAFFGCLGGACCATCGTVDFNGDGDFGTDQDIEAFFHVISGGLC